MIRFFTRLTRHVFFVGLILVAILISMLRVAVLCVDLYKTELENELSVLLDAPVKVGSLRAFMRGFSPELVLENIELINTNAVNNIQLSKVRLGIDAFKLLRNRQLLSSSWLTLVGVKLSVIRQLDGSFEIEGLKGGSGQPLWLLEGAVYKILDSEITWLDKKRQGKIVTFKNVDLMIKNHTTKNRHEAHLITQLPNKYGQKLRVSVDFSGNIFAPDNLVGKVFIEGEKIQVSQLITGDLPLDLEVNRGVGDFKLLGFWQKNQLTSLRGSINFKDLALVNLQKQSLKLQHLKSDFAWQNQQTNWKLAVKDFVAKIENKSYPTAEFVLGSPNKQAGYIAANITRLDLAQLSVLQHFFSSLFADIPTPLNQLKLQGLLEKTRFFADIPQQKYALNAQFKHVSVSSKDYPDLKNLSGFIIGNEQQGKIVLKTKQAFLEAKDLFKQSLEINELTGTVSWKQQDENWLLATEQLKLITPFLQSYHQALISIPKQEDSPFIDVQSSVFGISNMSHLRHYFPLPKMSSGLAQWLDAAFVSGNIKRVDALVYGRLEDFPYKNHAGVFQVLFSPENAELKYATDWPPFKSLYANVMFLNDSLEVVLKRATSGKMYGHDFKITIPSLSESDYLYAKGKLNGKLVDGLDFLQQSPLDLPIASVRENLKLKGSTDIDLELSVPLDDNLENKVKGIAKFKRAGFNVSSVDIDVKRLQGELKFTEKGLYAQNLTATALGQPINIHIDTDDENTYIKTVGKISAKRLFEEFDFKHQQLADGLADYNLTLSLPHDEKQARLKIASNLEGFKINLADNLGKTEKEKKAFSALFHFTDVGDVLLPVNFNYGTNLQADLRFHKKRKQLYSGNILWGKGQVEKPVGEGLKLSIKTLQFSLSKWRELLQTTHNEKTKPLLSSLNIDTQKLIWNEKDLGFLKLSLKPQSSSWHGSIDSKLASGAFQIPFEQTRNSKIKLNMESINLSAFDVSFPKSQHKASDVLPLIDIESKSVLWRDVNLGRFKLRSERLGNGVKFKEIKLDNGQQQLSLTGNWHQMQGRSRTKIQGEFKTEFFGEFLKKLDFSNQIKETSASIKVDFDWQLAPYNLSFARLNGTLDLNLSEGRILGIEPGFGRVLGVIAFQQWLKRLQFNFDDLYKEGLSFNTIAGYFKFENGIAYTDNLVVDAIPAKISLKGTVDLNQKTLDQQIAVVPKSSDAIPIAGTIVGSIATAIAQTVTGEYEEGYYLRSKYQVAGNWKDLKITPLHEQDGLLKKTWRSLTDFSWLEEQQE